MTKQVNSRFRSVRQFNHTIEKLLQDKFLNPGLRIALLQMHKETKASLSFLAHIDGVPRQVGRLRAIESLQIGGGEHYLSGFVNLDVFPPADVIWDCRYGLPFTNDQYRFIFSEHFLEHLDFPISVKRFLKEARRVLKPGGTLFIGVPDGGKAIRSYCDDKGRRFLNQLYSRCYRNRRPRAEIYGKLDLLNYLFRDQVENPRYTVHYWAYDFSSLKSLLLSVGFRSVKIAKFNGRYCNLERKFYTLYIKAVK